MNGLGNILLIEFYIDPNGRLSHKGANIHLRLEFKIFEFRLGGV